METPEAPDLNAYPVCKICDRGTLMPRKIRRLSGPAVAIGYILLIPSILGMVGCAILLIISLFAGVAGAAHGSTFATAFAGIGSIAFVYIGIFCFVSGLLGWLLIMKKYVLQCGYCGAVVNAVAPISTQSEQNAVSARNLILGALFILGITGAIWAIIVAEAGSQDSASTATTAEQVLVPFVGCPSDGQVGPLDAPRSADRLVRVPADAARRLAYYKAENGDGVLAPRGWHCFSFYGSASSSLLVSPDAIQPANWKGFYGPAIQISDYSGDTSGRFDVAKVIARVFPAYSGFVNDVIAEGIEPASAFPFGPYPKDKLNYRSKTVVEFETPANTEGLGTMSYLQKSANLIRGVAILHGEAPYSSVQLSMRLSEDTQDLSEIILLETEHENEAGAHI